MECSDVHQHETLYHYLMKGYQDYNSSLFLNKQIVSSLTVYRNWYFYTMTDFFYLGIVVFPHLTAHLVSIMLQLLPIGLPAFCFYLLSWQTQEQLKNRTKNKKYNTQLMTEQTASNVANSQEFWVWAENNFVLKQLRRLYLPCMFNSQWLKRIISGKKGTGVKSNWKSQD